MASYKSAEQPLNASASAVFSKLSNLEGLRSLIANIPADKVPEDKRQMLDSITITPDTISFPAGPVGAITLRLSEKIDPTLITLTGEGTPVPVGLSLHITPVDESSCKGQVEMNLEIPAMLKPMIGGQIQKAVDQFGDVLKAIPF